MSLHVALQMDPVEHVSIDADSTFRIGLEAQARELRDLAADTGVADHVIFTGSVPADDLAAYHNIADVFAMPSRTRGRGLDVEGLGIVYLEASASGVPVVAGLSGGAPETIEEGVTGTAVDGTDVDAVALAILSILGDRAAAAASGITSIASTWTAPA